jgi:hypothetical protein
MSGNDLIFRLGPSQSVAFVIFFTLCQVIGAMCTLPDLSQTEATARLVGERSTCPMDGIIVCPPSVTSS